MPDGRSNANGLKAPNAARGAIIPPSFWYYLRISITYFKIQLALHVAATRYLGLSDNDTVFNSYSSSFSVL